MQDHKKRLSISQWLAAGVAATGMIAAPIVASAQQGEMNQQQPDLGQQLNRLGRTGQQPAQQQPGQQQMRPQQAQSGEFRAAFSLSPGEIAKDAKKYVNERVAVHAEVEDLHNANLFTLDEDKILAGPDLLVLVRNPIAAVPEGQNVMVVGKIHYLRAADLEKEFDWYEPDLIQNLDQRPVLIAESIRSSRGIEYVQGPATTDLLFIKPGELAANPQQYYGRRVALKAEVEDVKNDHIFTLDEDQRFAGPDVLVVMPRFTRAAPENKDVTVIGTVRPGVVNELQSEFGWIDFNLGLDMGARPVVVADSVETYDGYELVQQDAAMGAGAGQLALIVLTPESQRGNLAGQAVMLESVQVSEVSGDRGFWVSTTTGQKLPVVLAEGVEPLKLDKGDYVTVSGVIMTMSPDVPANINLEEKGVALLQGQPIFLFATRANVVGKEPTRRPEM